MLGGVRDKALWLVVLLPGFLIIGIARLLSILPGLTEFILTILSLFFSIIVGGTAFFVLHTYFKLTGRSVRLEQALVSPSYLGMVGVLVIVFGVLVAVGYERAWLNRLVAVVLQSELVLPKRDEFPTIEAVLRVINSRENFERYFDDRHELRRSNTKALRVIFKGSTPTVIGRPKSWWFDGQNRQLYLTPACVVENGIEVPLAGPGIWVNAQEAVVIEVLDSVPASLACIEEQFAPRGAR